MSLNIIKIGLEPSHLDSLLWLPTDNNIEHYAKAGTILAILRKFSYFSLNAPIRYKLLSELYTGKNTTQGRGSWPGVSQTGSCKARTNPTIRLQSLVDLLSTQENQKRLVSNYASGICFLEMTLRKSQMTLPHAGTWGKCHSGHITSWTDSHIRMKMLREWLLSAGKGLGILPG